MWNDLKFAVRQFWKNPGFTVVAILTLALGIGANTAIFSVIDAVLLKPLPFPDQKRLITLWERDSKRGIEQERVSPMNLAEWQGQNQVFEKIGYWSGTDGDANLVMPEGIEKVNRAHVSAGLFEVLGVNPILGRGFVREEDEPNGNKSAVVSYEFWQRRLGGRSDVVGQTATIDTYGRVVYTIVGVMPPGFHFPEQTELWLAAGWNGIPRNRRSGHWYETVARLKPGLTLERAQAEMNTIQQRIVRENSDALIGSEIKLTPLLDQSVGPRLKPALVLLTAVVAGVLLIACANVANLLLARAVSRRREMALRAALGAGRWRIVRQLLIESLLLSIAGGLCGALLGWWSLQLFVGTSAGDIPRLNEARFDLRALVFTFGVATASGVLFGLAPVWQFARRDLDRVLREGSHAISGGLTMSRARSGLVVAEVAVSLLLLMGAAMMIESFLQMVRDDRGIRSEHLITADLDFSVSGFTTWVRATDTRPQVKLSEFMTRLRATPGVEKAAAASWLPNRPGPPSFPVIVEGRSVGNAAETIMAEYAGISPQYFETMGASLLRGRDFTEADQLDAPKVLIINETFAKSYFPGQSPLGKRMEMGGRKNPTMPDEATIAAWPQIVGVVSDIKSLTLGAESPPRVYVPYWQWPMQHPIVIARATGDPAQLTATVRQEVKEVIPAIPQPNIRTMDAILSRVVAQPRLQTWLLSLFGALAVILAAIGLYGTLAYGVAQRTHEIGIRMALGAERGRVLALIIREGMSLVAFGVFIGSILALIASRGVSRAFYGIEASGTGPLFAVLALLIVVGLFACWLPARRAAKVNPLEALRCE